MITPTLIAQTLTIADYGTVALTIFMLVILEGLLSADNALVLAVLVRHLPKEQQKRALRYGIIGFCVSHYRRNLRRATA